MNCAASPDVAECLKHLLMAMLPKGADLIETLKSMMVSSKEKDDPSGDDDDDEEDDDDDLD